MGNTKTNGKVRFISFLILFMTFSFLFLIPVQAERTILVGVDQFEPLVFFDEDGVAKGISIDILEEVAAEEGWEIEYVECTWPVCLEMLEDENIDLIVDMGYSPYRAQKYYLSSETILSDWGIVYVLPGSGIDSILDLEGKTIGVPQNDIFYLILRSNLEDFGINCTFVEVPGSGDVMQLLDSNEVDAGVMGRLYGLYYEDQFDVQRTNIIYSPLNRHFAVQDTDDQYIIDTIDRHIRVMKEDESSVYYTSRDRWLISDRHHHVPEWIKATLIAGFFVLLILAGFSFALRSQVEKRTRELKELNEELESEIEERKKVEGQLAERAEDLERLNEVKSIYTDILRHDLINPASAIKGFAGVVSRDIPDGPNKRYLKIIVENSERIIDMINAATEFSRLEESRELELYPMDLSDTINNSIAALKPNSDESNISVELKSPARYNVLANPILQTVFTNLISNAIKYSPEGSSVFIDVEDADKFWKVTVKDRGEGVEDADKPFIFDRFRRASKGKAKGTGLGLAIVKRIIELHNGDTGITDNPDGVGSVFWVILHKA